MWSNWLNGFLRPTAPPPRDGGGCPSARWMALLAFFSSSSLQAKVTGTACSGMRRKCIGENNHGPLKKSQLRYITETPSPQKIQTN